MGKEIEAMDLNRATGKPRRPFHWTLHRALPGLALCSVGVALLWLSLAQPAWVGTQVGPGLMAQLLSKAVIVIGILWALWRVFRPGPQTAKDLTPTDSAQPWSGPALLGAVLVFALTLPLLGLVIPAALAVALAALGAGERSPVALAVTVIGLGALTAVIGATLLPPTTPLWPTF